MRAYSLFHKAREEEALPGGMEAMALGNAEEVVFTFVLYLVDERQVLDAGFVRSVAKVRNAFVGGDKVYGFGAGEAIECGAALYAGFQVKGRDRFVGG